MAFHRISTTAVQLAAVLCAFTAFAAMAKTPSESFKDLGERFLKTHYELNPIAATQNGVPGHADKFVNNLSEAFRQREAEFYASTLASLRAIDPTQLSPEDRLNYEVLSYRVTRSAEALRYDFHLTPINHFFSLPLTLLNFAGGDGAQPLKTVADYDAFLKRLDGFPGWVDSAIDNMREGMRRGIVQPKVVMQRVAQQMKSQVVETPEQSGFYRPVTRFPTTFTAEERARLTEAYRQSVQNKITPAFKRLHDFIDKEYLPKCRDAAGIGALPGGAALYAFRARESTTTDLTPEQIHEIGLKEVARIRGEMEKVRKQVGFEGDVSAFLASINKNPAMMPFKTEEEVIEAFRAIQRRVEPLVAKLFSRTPRSKLEIRPVPALTRATAAAHYIAGAPDGSRPGVFYAPVRDPATYTTPRMTALFLHEGFPGHHFEVSLANESNLPAFRRVTRFTAYSEGWGLYAESLGQEMGAYEDPYQFLGRLQSEMHRAIRLVVDTGIHAKGWTREQAIQYSLANNGGREQDQVQEIERYIALPGQALAYKIGEIKIFELRRYAEEKLGTAFSLKDFHEEVLKDGNLPLAVLEAKMKRWVDSRLRAASAAR